MKIQNCFLLSFFLAGLIFVQAAPLKFSKAAFTQKTSLDTAKLLSDEPLKSPMGAVYRSAVLPGWGQLYTGHYLKAGIAAALNGGMIYQIVHFQNKWKGTRNPDFQSKRNLFTWYFAATYFLTMIDAYVDAYLFKFDEAINISQNIRIKDHKWLAELRFSLQF